MNRVLRLGSFLGLLLVPALGFCGSGELSLSLDALGDAVLSPSGSPSPLGVGASAGLNYRFPDVPYLGLGLNFGFNEFPGGSGMQTSWLDLDAHFYPFEATPAGEWYLEAGLGPTLFSDVLPNHWAGQYHGTAGIGYLLSLGGNEALDLGLQYDYFNPFNGPLQDLAMKVGFCWNLDEAPAPGKKEPSVSETPESQRVEASAQVSPEPNAAEAAPESTAIQTEVHTPTETPVRWAEEESLSAKLTANIYFGYNHSRVMPGAQKRMATLADRLKTHRGDRIELNGYTDNKGEADKNEELSLTRAQSVKDILVQAGIPEDQIEVSGKGMADPIADNETPAGRAKNRRVEIKVLKPGE